MQRDTEAADLPLPQRQDLPAAFIEKLRKIPCLGIAMAFASGVCFATASFTVELMQGDSGLGIDASLVVAGRYVQSACSTPLTSLTTLQVTRSIHLLSPSGPDTERSSFWRSR